VQRSRARSQVFWKTYRWHKHILHATAIIQETELQREVAAVCSKCNAVLALVYGYARTCEAARNRNYRSVSRCVRLQQSVLFHPVLGIDGLVQKEVKPLTHDWDHFHVGACKAKNGRCTSLCGSSEMPCAVVCVGWYQKSFISTSFIQVDT